MVLQTRVTLRANEAQKSYKMDRGEVFANPISSNTLQLMIRPIDMSLVATQHGLNMHKVTPYLQAVSLSCMSLLTPRDFVLYL